jgi:hypothetical protein
MWLSTLLFHVIALVINFDFTFCFLFYLVFRIDRKCTVCVLHRSFLMKQYGVMLSKHTNSFLTLSCRCLLLKVILRIHLLYIFFIEIIRT